MKSKGHPNGGERNPHLDLILPGNDGAWYVVVEGIVRAELKGSKQNARRQLQVCLNHRAKAKPLATQTIRLVLNPYCSSCGVLAKNGTLPLLALERAILHTKKTGHIVILNGTTDAVTMAGSQ